MCVSRSFCACLRYAHMIYVCNICACLHLFCACLCYACMMYVCNVCACAGMGAPQHACGSHRTISGTSPHLPPCLTQDPIAVCHCVHPTSWPASFWGASCFCPSSLQSSGISDTLLHVGFRASSLLSKCSSN